MLRRPTLWPGYHLDLPAPLPQRPFDPAPMRHVRPWRPPPHLLRRGPRPRSSAWIAQRRSKLTSSV
eukprot:scaffold205432_cov24-Tisochrysis_lutea.AAC.2